MKLHWSIFALMTVLAWGMYGTLLNWGAMGFHHDRIKAFLFVGIAYFLVAVLAPLVIIAINGSGFNFSEFPKGITWSLIAGVAGAIGALTVLFALSNNIPPGATPKQAASAASQVMSLVFAGAPVVAAIFGIIMNPPKDGLGALDWRFLVGMVLAASGGAMVTLFKP